uniref:THAP-type domain-containing protein n=1 Tax=Oryzias latipes TaxID=8090 RepID=A0A3P9JEC0_ORYLA
MPSRCVAAGCSNTSSESVSVYKFPKQETLLKQWTKQVQRTRANWVPTASSTLCSEHFEADYMGMHVRYKKVLKPNAIPTIFKRSLTYYFLLYPPHFRKRVRIDTVAKVTHHHDNLRNFPLHLSVHLMINR